MRPTWKLPCGRQGREVFLGPYCNRRRRSRSVPCGHSHVPPPAWGTGQRNGGARPREGSPRCSRHGSQTGETAAPAGRACHAAGFECPVARGARELRTPQRARRASEECGVPGAVRWAALYQAASGPVRAREFGVGPWGRHAGCSVCSATVRDRRVVSGVWRVPTVPRAPGPRVSDRHLLPGPGADVGRQLIEGAGSLGSRGVVRCLPPPVCAGAGFVPVLLSSCARSPRSSKRGDDSSCSHPTEGTARSNASVYEPSLERRGAAPEAAALGAVVRGSKPGRSRRQLQPRLAAR